MPIQPRQMDFHFDPDDIPVNWSGIRLLSHAVNGMNLVFPEGERFFIRSVRHYLPQITDPTLRDAVRDFARQEALHGHEHTRAFEMLKAQGFSLDGWLETYTRQSRWLESSQPPALRLAVTAALEHLTASLAHFTLTTRFLADGHPTMCALLEWHAVEEMEHKAVAFDVFQQVDGRYWVRVLGMAIGLATFLYFWTSGIRHLLKQDPDFDRATVRAQRRQIRKRLGILNGRLLVSRHALPYLRPGFHPSDIDDRSLREQALARLARYIRPEGLRAK